MQMIKGCRAVAVPWGTHLGVVLELKTSIGAASYRSIMMPRKFESYDATSFPAVARRGHC